MKYKVLTFDGRFVHQVQYNSIKFCKHPKLLDHATTMESLKKAPAYYYPEIEEQRLEMLAKCELEEVELRFTKDV